MDSRWRNLLIAIAVLFLVFLAYWLIPKQAPLLEGTGQSVASYELAEAEINAVLIATPGFEPKSGSFKTIDPVALGKAKEQIQSVKARVQNASNFSDKSAALALADAWIARIDLAVAWKKLQNQAASANFSGKETDAVICAQKSYFTALRDRLVESQSALAKTEETHNALVTGFSVLAANAGFVGPADSELDSKGLGLQLQTIQEILGGCS